MCTLFFSLAAHSTLSICFPRWINCHAIVHAFLIVVSECIILFACVHNCIHLGSSLTVFDYFLLLVGCIHLISVLEDRRTQGVSVIPQCLSRWFTVVFAFVHLQVGSLGNMFACF